jgi:hypothetical protein
VDTGVSKVHGNTRIRVTDDATGSRMYTTVGAIRKGLPDSAVVCAAARQALLSLEQQLAVQSNTVGVTGLWTVFAVDGAQHQVALTLDKVCR